MSPVTPLPIDSHLPDVVAALRAGRDVVLVAEPGAGKTTRVPPAIVRAHLLPTGKHLAMLQPRRIAARAAAARIADEQRWQLGLEVGYQVRFERVLRDDTPLRIMTEGVLVRRLVSDPTLDDVGVVVLDEFHERSIDLDLSLAMLKEAQAVRDDLRLVVMSATLDADAVARYLGENVATFHIPGRLFPVDVTYAGDDPRPIEERVARVMDAEAAASDQSGDVLVFLPGVREIENTIDALRRPAARAGYDVLPLHGSLTKDEQDAAVRFDARDRPKIICATNVAETSLTLPGVRLVIDSGLVRQAGYDATRGVDTLTTERISKASAEQRAGRAGRVAEGRCVRLWSKMTHQALPPFDVPELQRSDLCQAALAVLAWGGDPRTFAWFEPPPAKLLDRATTLLEGLGAFDDGRLTPLGRALQRVPLHPRPARLIASAHKHLRPESITVAALLGEQADLPGKRTANIHDLLVAFDSGKLDPTTDRAVRRARQALSNLKIDAEAAASGSAETLEELLLLAHPDRVCRRRSPDSATLADGGGVRLPDPSAVRGDWFLALAVRRGNFAKAMQADVSLVAEIEPSWLERHLPQFVKIEQATEWAGDRVVAVRRKMYRALVLDEQRGGKLEDWAAAEAILRQQLSEPGTSLLSDERAAAVVAADAELERLFQRIDFAQAMAAREGRTFEDTPTRSLLLYEACTGATSLAEVRRNAKDLLDLRFASDRDNWLTRVAPDAITVPSGSRIRLDWSTAEVEPAPVRSSPIDPELKTVGPTLAVRLQELFGLAETPRVANGAVPVTLHLLAPNGRPQQVTNDLASFWKNTYAQVRRDLRARYPKHSWPDNPLKAEPLRGAKRRK